MIAMITIEFVMDYFMFWLGHPHSKPNASIALSRPDHTFFLIP